jgi:hypothetical protein
MVMFIPGISRENRETVSCRTGSDPGTNDYIIRPVIPEEEKLVEWKRSSPLERSAQRHGRQSIGIA